MSSVQQRALQSIKSFRNLQLTRPRSFPEPSAEPTKIKGIVRTNPFIPQKHKYSGKWRPADYSLRRQAVLAKNAYATNTMHLLPSSPKTEALKLRIQRVKASLSPALSAALKPAPVEDAITILTAQLEELTLATNKPLKALEEERVALQERIDGLMSEIEQFEIINLVDFSKNSPEYVANERRKANLAALKKQVGQKTKEITLITGRIMGVERAMAKAKRSPFYARRMHWVGKVAKKQTAGSKLGIRLYAGRKRMFKGHLWERQKAGRLRKRAVLMRDMAARVARYKEYYKKRKPNPLKPSRYSKPPKLPY